MKNLLVGLAGFFAIAFVSVFIIEKRSASMAEKRSVRLKLIRPTVFDELLPSSFASICVIRGQIRFPIPLRSLRFLL